MKLPAIRSGCFLIGWFLLGNLRLVLGRLLPNPFAGCCEFYRACCRSAKLVRVVLCLRGPVRVEAIVNLCQQVGIDKATLARNPDAAFILATRLHARQSYQDVVAMLTPVLDNSPVHSRCFGARGMALLERGDYPRALADLTRCHELDTKLARDYNYNLYRAYLHGLRGDTALAQQALVDHYVPGASGPPPAALAWFLHKNLCDPLTALELRGSIGVFLSVAPTALGHAILDPFHFINLFRHRFDNLVMVHPPLAQYTPATRLTTSILEQYVERLESDNHHVLNFSWQNLGELSHENVTFLVYNYWSLNRLAFQARHDPAHPMHHGRDYLRLPPRLLDRAEAVCRRNGIDLDGPVVVVHTREHGYHGLSGQTYRNTDVRNYCQALRKLIARGFQVVRVGDRKMTSIQREVPGLIELPRTDYYCPLLDPYLISRCEFMISCQSGPCSYARVFGKPNLVVNAVYHYTLIPENNDLVAFKDYRNLRTGERLSALQIFQVGAQLFDRTEHFTSAGIEVVDMTAEEIEAAVDEMLAWVGKPELPETPAQMQFRRLMQHFMHHIDASHRLATPLTDYIGYVLPECRICDAVASGRPGYLSVGAEPQGAIPLSVVRNAG